MSSKPHIINLPDLQKWIEENETLYASDGHGKRLLVTMSGGFRIRINGEIVWEGTQPFTAVETYNAL